MDGNRGKYWPGTHRPPCLAPAFIPLAPDAEGPHFCDMTVATEARWISHQHFSESFCQVANKQRLQDASRFPSALIPEATRSGSFQYAIVSVPVSY